MFKTIKLIKKSSYLSLICIPILIFLFGASQYLFAVQMSMSYDFETTDWKSPHFSLVGDASWPDDLSGNDSKRLRMTPDYYSRLGSGWVNSHQINPSEDWSTEYTIVFTTHNVSDCGVGVSFNIQPNGTAANPGEYYEGPNVLSVSMYNIPIDLHRN